jgi:hypothetical protein
MQFAASRAGHSFFERGRSGARSFGRGFARFAIRSSSDDDVFRRSGNFFGL